MPTPQNNNTCQTPEEARQHNFEIRRTKSLSLELNHETHKALRIIAAKTDSTMSSILIQALHQFIKKDDDLNAKAENIRRRLA